MTTTLRAPDPHARSPRPRPVVLLDGTGALLDPLAELLSRSGHEVRAGAAELVAADHALRDGARGAPRLVIVVAARALSPTRASAWRGLVAHLPVVYDERTVMIGPVVAAGPPCLHCLDLHRHDHDPSWPARRGGLLAAGGEPAPDAALATVATGLAALLARNVLEQRRHLHGVSLELDASSPFIRPRRWAPHPLCVCSGAQGTMQA